MKSTARARATIPAPPRDMTHLERDYEAYLETCRRGDLIIRYDFEPERLRLGLDFSTTYCPDFRIVMPDGTLEFHEVKGWWREDARVKIKAAASQHPYIFRAVTRKRGRDAGWHWETFTRGAMLWLDTPR